MSLFTDIKSVSDSAIEQLSGRFPNLPRPLLAAIGAGDMAVERLAALREQLTERIGATGGAPSGEDVKAFAADLPARAQQVAGEVSHNLEQFASTAPEKVQKLIGELPAKTSELTESLSPENIRGTVESYTQFVAMIYENLSERGEKAVAQARSGAGSRSTGAASATGMQQAKPAASATSSQTRKPRSASSQRSAASSSKAAKTAKTASKTARSTASKTATSTGARSASRASSKSTAAKSGGRTSSSRSAGKGGATRG